MAEMRHTYIYIGKYSSIHVSVKVQDCQSLHVEDPFKVTRGKRKQDIFIGDSSTTETVGEGD